MSEFLLFIIVVLAIALAAAAGALIFLLLRSQHSVKKEDQFEELAKHQAEMAGRIQAMGEALSGRQAELSRVVSERLDSVSNRLGASLENTTKQTADRLQNLHERLALIDNAQKNLTELSSQVTSLRDVLANKQARGAFGQARMEAIVQDGLPKGFYEFQYTLSNNTRPDCVVFLPDKRPLVIDAKFPLEAVTALRDANSEDARKHASQRIRQDIAKHVADIAGKYLIPGETQDLALMFVPSESIYAELHDSFDDIVQKAYRARVVIVSPALLMLAIQVMQQIMKDARMREAADLIRTEVGRMLEDVGRLRERVSNLQQHFGQANKDIEQILISSGKIGNRANKITELEFETDEAAVGHVSPASLEARE